MNFASKHKNKMSLMNEKLSTIEIKKFVLFSLKISFVFEKKMVLNSSESGFFLEINSNDREELL